MHLKLLKEVIDICQRRHLEGDCSTTKAVSIEMLEEAIVTLNYQQSELVRKCAEICKGYKVLQARILALLPEEGKG